MEIRQLRYFLAIAQCGGFTAAASRIGIAQPALSAQVAKLEDEVGTVLFRRGRRGVELTPAGERLASHASRILQDVESARREIRSFSKLAPVEVMLGIPTLASNLLIAPLLDETRTRLPWITVRIVESMGAALRAQFASGKIDLAMMYKAPDDAFGDAELILEEDFYVVAKNGFPGWSYPECRFEDLSEVPLVLSIRGNSHREQLEDYSKRKGISLKIVAEVDSISGQRELVFGGAAATILPLSGIKHWPATALHVSRLREADLVSQAFLVAKSSSIPNAALDPLKDAVRRVVARLVERGEWTAARMIERARLPTLPRGMVLSHDNERRANKAGASKG